MILLQVRLNGLQVATRATRPERGPWPSRLRRGGCELWADALDELLRRWPAPLGAERLVRGQQMRATPGIQTVGVGPALVYPTPGIRPVVIYLAAEQVSTDPPHVLV